MVVQITIVARRPRFVDAPGAFSCTRWMETTWNVLHHGLGTKFSHNVLTKDRIILIMSDVASYSPPNAVALRCSCT
jgi:hypothetical protein